MGNLRKPVRADISEDEANRAEALVFEINNLKCILHLIDTRSLPNREYYFRLFVEKHLDLEVLHEQLAEKYFKGRQVQNVKVNYKSRTLFCEELSGGEHE